MIVEGHQMFCVSQPMPEFERVIWIENAPDGRLSSLAFSIDVGSLLVLNLLRRNLSFYSNNFDVGHHLIVLHVLLLLMFQMVLLE